MKQLLSTLLIFLLFSCSKELKEAKSEISGTWEYEKYVGYPFNTPALLPGNGKIIVIHKNGKFERKQHDTLLYSGSYKLEKKPDCHPNHNDIFFSSDEAAYGIAGYVEVTNDKLSISSSNCMADGGMLFYRRIN